MIIALIALSPFLAMILFMILGTRRNPRLASAVNGYRGICLPAAEETAYSIRRFHEAVERHAMLDFVWERYSHGRGLLTEELARIIRLKPSPRKKARPASRIRIPEWL